MLPDGVASPVPELLARLAAGEMVVLVDTADPDSDCEVLVAGEFATSENLNFMARHARGLISLALERRRVVQLGLPAMAAFKTRTRETAFTVSIEARDGVTTGISTADRARTIAVAIDPALGPEHIVTPGHLFPLVAREGGVLARAGYTEAAVDLATLAGLNPSGVLCQVMRDDGTMARPADIAAFAARHNLAIGTMASVVAWRRRTEKLVTRASERRIEAVGGSWLLVTYTDRSGGGLHLTLAQGNAAGPAHVHILAPEHDLLVENGLDTLHDAMRRVGAAGQGAVLVLRRAEAADDAEMQAIGAQILEDLRGGA
jgi:3,4-dihydroxy 2-butanone 4-phosphate synthase/GTP cyclohydrolase II